MEPWKKQLRRLPLESQKHIVAALRLLLERDFSQLDRLQLKGHPGIFRIRVGSYRIIYHDDGEKITLKSIPRRDDNTYKTF